MSVDRLTPAESLLWSYGITDPKHIDLEAIASDCGAEVKYRPLDGCEARLVTYGDTAIISVNINSSDGRKRFSLAHELAHWLCDRKTGSFLCVNADIGPQNAESKSIEANANAYASQLILPNYLVEPWMQGRGVTLDVARSLSNDFNTSLTAAAIKLVKRASVPACVACHNQSKLLWHQRSSIFPLEYYVVAELHQDTDAFRMAFGATGMSRPKREPAPRWISGPNVYRHEVTAQSIKLPDGTVLTMITVNK